MDYLSGKVAVVTGASRGIGNAVARRLAADGASVAILSTQPDAANAAAASIPRARGYACDVASFNNVTACMDDILADFGTVDILVNNAGITRDSLLLRMSEDDWDRVIAVNLKGVFNACKAAMRPMLKARTGRIINIASVVALTGNPGQTNYAAAKAGIIGFTKSLARETASRNITVNAVAPGFIDTDMSAAIPEPARNAITASIPLRRPGTPDDVAAAVAFLAGPDAAYITGEVIRVDGGLAM